MIFIFQLVINILIASRRHDYKPQPRINSITYLLSLSTLLSLIFDYYFINFYMFTCYAVYFVYSYDVIIYNQDYDNDYWKIILCCIIFKPYVMVYSFAKVIGTILLILLNIIK